MATKNVYNDKAAQHRPEYIASLENYMKYEETMLTMGLRDTGRYAQYKAKIEELKTRQERATEGSTVVYLDEARLLKPFIDTERKEKRKKK